MIYFIRTNDNKNIYEVEIYANRRNNYEKWKYYFKTYFYTENMIKRYEELNNYYDMLFELNRTLHLKNDWHPTSKKEVIDWVLPKLEEFCKTTDDNFVIVVD